MRHRFCLSALSFALAATLLGSCATQPKMRWIRTDGQRVADNPVLMQQGQLDMTMCQGEMQKANLSGVAVYSGGLAGVAAQIERNQAASDVAKGCMASKGYVLVPEEQAEAQRQYFADIAAAQQAQQAAAARPASKR